MILPSLFPQSTHARPRAMLANGKWRSLEHARDQVMRIAYYAPAWPPSGAANGIVTYVDTMRRHLLTQGHDVSVIAQNTLHTADGRTFDLAPGSDAPGLLQRLKWRIDHRRGEHPFAAIELARQLNRARDHAGFDLIEMEESFGWCGVVQRKLDVPVVTRLHGPEFMKPRDQETRLEQRQSRQRIAAEGRAVGGAVAVSAPTLATLAHTRFHYRQSLDGGTVIPNPVHLLADPQDLRAAREKGTILCVGRFDYIKGADTMLEAFASLVASGRDVRLIMVGPDTGFASPSGRRIYFNDYAAHNLSPSARERVAFTGTQTPAQISALRQRATLTVVASRYENFPYSAVEAMAAATPVISTDWAGSAEVITDGVTGWITPMGDADRLASRIAWVLDHPDIAKDIGIAGWRRCQDAFSPAAVCRRSLDFYAEVLARHAR